jgi:hypothetical protein
MDMSTTSTIGRPRLRIVRPVPFDRDLFSQQLQAWMDANFPGKGGETAAARRIGIGHRQFHRWLKGDYQESPAYENLESAAKAMGLDVQDFGMNNPGSAGLNVNARLAKLEETAEAIQHSVRTILQQLDEVLRALPQPQPTPAQRSAPTARPKGRRRQAG